MTQARLNAPTPFGVSEQAFPGVTPSFHLSDNQFYETIFFRSSFLFFNFLGSTPNLFS